MRYLVLVLVFAGCTDLFGPEVTIWGKRPMDPVPEEYPVWYAEVEDCLGQTGDYGAVEWFVVDSIRAGDRSTVAAITFPNDIMVMPHRVFREEVLKHEMVHHVTQSDDNHSTPDLCEGH